MDAQSIKLIKQYVEQYIENADLREIIAVVLVGSSSITCINNPHDIDVCVCVSPTVERRTRYVAGLRAALQADVSPKISVLTRIPDEWYEAGGLLKTYAFQSLPRFAINIVGDVRELAPPEKVDVLMNKDKYINSLKHYWFSEHMEKHIRKYGRLKALYLALLVVYFIDNNSYELTDEQRRNVNIAHDLADGWEELHDWFINKLKEY